MKEFKCHLKKLGINYTHRGRGAALVERLGEGMAFLISSIIALFIGRDIDLNLGIIRSLNPSF